jgi:uncharacterized protein YndB with AHSA1/START domain
MKQERRNTMKNTLTVTTPSDREIVMTRSFDAPRSLVFDAYTKPELVKRWLLGPPGWTMPVCEIDLRVGGKYRYVWRSDSDGTEFGMGGVYREVVRPTRIVHTEVFNEGEALVTEVFSEQAGKTTFAITMLFASREARDGALATGMTDGVALSYDKLDEMLAPATAEGAKGTA